MSRYSRATVEYYQGIFQHFGSRGSVLTVVPFNQGSKQDVEPLVDYIYATLGMDLDYILPFAAVPENGREIDGLDDKSELAHRIMLVNLLRLLGAVKSKKASRHFVTHPTQSKVSLETLFQRWNSESWGEYLCLAGAVIGWTRGTGLMDATNTVAQDVESHGVRTFSAKEMAFNILGLMHPLLFSITPKITTRICVNINKKSKLQHAIARDNSADFKVINGVEAECVLQTLESAETIEDLAKLRDVVDLEKVCAITGFAELGPWGSSLDAKTNEPVDNKDVRGKYKKDILAHAGVRLIEPELFRGYDTKHKVFHHDQEIELTHDLGPLEVSDAEAEAEKFKE
ncbi:hypothetical protein EWM64_g8970 [Hericium alpestre]|uniref:Uncharacterized protein n=1 Tax=Hericium alpestre TaxID=135208 RepID=A0A4Y9ZJX6_9AGAM|nr:hypothetical protein EWM64_g8970 [Hericium alpestre]